MSASDNRFAETVRIWLATAEFYPAAVGGRPVKQLIQQPFTFSLK